MVLGQGLLAYAAAVLLLLAASTVSSQPPSSPTPPTPPPPVRPDNVCDANYSCSAGSTCCCVSEIKNICLIWGCCPIQGATCCKDGVNCCPPDYPVCNISAQTCSASENSPLSMPALKFKPATLKTA